MENNRLGLSYGNSDPIFAYHPLFSKITGDLASGMLLSQLDYLWKKNKRKPFNATNEYLVTIFGINISEKSLIRKKNILKELNLITVERGNNFNRSLYTINEELIKKTLNEPAQDLVTPKTSVSENEEIAENMQETPSEKEKNLTPKTSVSEKPNSQNFSQLTPKTSATCNKDLNKDLNDKKDSSEPDLSVKKTRAEELAEQNKKIMEIEKKKNSAPQLDKIKEDIEKQTDSLLERIKKKETNFTYDEKAEIIILLATLLGRKQTEPEEYIHKLIDKIKSKEKMFEWLMEGAWNFSHNDFRMGGKGNDTGNPWQMITLISNSQRGLDAPMNLPETDSSKKARELFGYLVNNNFKANEKSSSSDLTKKDAEIYSSLFDM